ncbi:MAG: hypothetical protein QXF76_04020 [Candidatus Anstonellales archaeon]
MLTQNEQILVNQLKTFGYPNVGDNVRVKPYNMYDTLTITSSIQAYYFFVNSNLDQTLRNRILPISSNEIIFINSLNLELSNLDHLPYDTNIDKIFTNSCLTISVDDRIKFKTCLAEVLNFNIANNNAQGGTSTDTTFLYETRIKRKRNLLFPIIINSSSNVSIKLELDSAAATILNNKNIRINLRGVKFDKMTPFVYDPVRDNRIERLSFTLYDSNLYNQSGGTYDLFSTQNKANTLYSKIFPLGDKESFSIENIEIFFATAADTTTAFNAGALYNTLLRAILKIYIDDIEFVNFLDEEFITLLRILKNSSYEYWSNHYFTNFGFTLDNPIIIPAASRVKATITLPATNYLRNTDYFTVMFKGTLQRIVA